MPVTEGATHNSGRSLSLSRTPSGTVACRNLLDSDNSKCTSVDGRHFDTARGHHKAGCTRALRIELSTSGYCTSPPLLVCTHLWGKKLCNVESCNQSCTRCSQDGGNVSGTAAARSPVCSPDHKLVGCNSKYNVENKRHASKLPLADSAHPLC
mmetsp:Transcript_28400/g.68226  ORF Transcript_28400/g.68226 Transcript_28400/m.68226 type:complete len:153 (-) Transcript_28400:662-1120(-)